MSFIIGLYGPAKVGKTTTGKALIKGFKKLYPELTVKFISFADPLYEIVSILTDVPVKKLQDQSYKEVVWTKETAPIPAFVGWTPRKLLQIVGTECFRNQIHQEIWIQLAINRCKKYDITIIGDCRFSNELKISNFNIELKRNTIDYAKNHASAMPPDPELINKQIKLYKKIDFLETINEIYKLYKDNKNAI